jgi:hypothetical protein
MNIRVLFSLKEFLWRNYESALSLALCKNKYCNSAIKPCISPQENNDGGHLASHTSTEKTWTW